MIQSTLRFLLLLTVSMAAVFGIHVIVLSQLGLLVFENSIIGCYIFNYLIATITFTCLLLMKDKLSGSLGFIFMGSSLVKFGLFFLIFYSDFKADNVISKPEFAAFFIPYALALIIEVIFLSKTLNK